MENTLENKELIQLLKECRDLLVMCTLLDKSTQCKTLVDKVDIKMNWENTKSKAALKLLKI